MTEPTKLPLTVGLLAHVDAGKTTLGEGLLYLSGARRTLGRVDHRDTALDTHALERSRGITIFSRQARLETPSRRVILVDTPGHADLAAEAERVMPVLDLAVLVISGTDGVQAHTLTLWRLLEKYAVPVYLFVNKLDLPGPGREALLKQLQARLSPGCVDMGQPPEALAEAAALCDDALLENYLAGGQVTAANLRELIARRRLFPCRFGSALHLEGVAELLSDLDTYAPRRDWPQAFAARVYKISRDPQGTRLTWLRVTGGVLHVRSSVTYQTLAGEGREEKVSQIRLYSADKFTAPEEAGPGELTAVAGLTGTWAGQRLGAESAGQAPVLEPVLTYRIALPLETDVNRVLPGLRELEEEDPQLHLEAEGDTLHVRLMGRVQGEIFRALVQERLGLEIALEDPRIRYLETIAAPVEGVGHFEPLRHYAEVHLLLEPLPRGSGLQFATTCPTDVLDASYQSLVLTHLAEKIHRGVLTGAPITDIKLTLLVGKAHQKHTEGGDFRQATYRAVRQGLMGAESLLLEPWYDFTLAVPAGQIGRAISDIRAMGGAFDPPEGDGEISTLSGRVPASEVGDYAADLAAYTQGRGQLRLSLAGYDLCHNAQAVIAATGYDPEADTANPADSVFCAHGAGYVVRWDQVKNYMHLDSGLHEEKAPQILTRNLALEDKELERILEREFGPIRRPVYGESRPRPATEEIPIQPPKQKYLIVDGYNILFAWEDLAKMAADDLDAARRSLCDTLSSFAGYTGCRLVVVFDGYLRRGSSGEKERLNNIQIVYTKEGETADAYIAALAQEVGGGYTVWAASSDALVQLSSLGSGVLRISARELHNLVTRTQEDMHAHFQA